MQALTVGGSTTYEVARYSAGAYAEVVDLGAALRRNIQRVRASRGWSQTDLARRLHELEPEFQPAPGRISEWESGRYKTIELKNLMLLAMALECSMDVLLVGVHRAYDAIVKPQAPVPAGLSDEDHELLALVRDESWRRILRLLAKPEQAELRAWLLTMRDPAEESTGESTPDRQAVAGEKPRKHGRAGARADGKRR